MIGDGPQVALGGRLADGEVVGDYEVLALAGAGGMGLVYRANQRSLNRVVALKLIREDISRQPEYRVRFLREAKLAASVDHPNVVKVYDVDEQDDRLYLAMQWVDGQDLRSIIDRTGRLAPERAAAITRQIASALDAVHGVAGLVHRDVKPANVLVRSVDGIDHAYLTDFGVAKPAEDSHSLTQTGSVVGTTGYLSPEQIKGQEPGPRSDLYALGCLFFEALTGSAPFTGENELAVRWAHANDPRPLVSRAVPALGQRYDQFFMTALAVNPDQRFASGREFSEALQASQQSVAVAAATPLPGTDHTPTAIGPPLPLPPPGMQYTPPPGYPIYGYGTPTPAPAANKSGNPLALIVLGLIALAGIAVGALAAAGVFSHSSGASTITRVSTTPTGNASKLHAAKLRHPKSSHAKKTASPGGGPARTICGGDLSVGPDTSCPFGANVEAAYDQSSGGNTDVVATSPVTGQTYTMQCSGGVPHVCTGGNNASVYFSSGPGAAPAPATNTSATPSVPSSPGGLTACDQNISAGPGTSCPFAENVFQAYASDYKANGEQPSVQVQANSPVTGRQYQMTCVTDGTTVGCTGGNNAYVTYPFHAVVVY